MRVAGDTGGMAETITWEQQRDLEQAGGLAALLRF